MSGKTKGFIQSREILILLPWAGLENSYAEYCKLLCVRIIYTIYLIVQMFILHPGLIYLFHDSIAIAQNIQYWSPNYANTGYNTGEGRFKIVCL